jgi:hypothetical protein
MLLIAINTILLVAILFASSYTALQISFIDNRQREFIDTTKCVQYNFMIALRRIERSFGVMIIGVEPPDIRGISC